MNTKFRNMSTGAILTARELSKLPEDENAKMWEKVGPNKGENSKGKSRYDKGAMKGNWPRDMATDDDDEEDEGQMTPPGSMMGDEPPDGAPPTGGKPPVTPGRDMPGSSADDAQYKEFLMDMARCGIVVPEGTQKKDFMKVAHGALKTKLATMQDNSPDADAGGPDSPGSGKPKADAAGTAVEEQRPILMSLSNHNDPTVRMLLNREQTAGRKRRLAKINQMRQRGMPQVDVDRLTQEASRYNLSLRTDGSEVKTALDRELATWDKALPQNGFSDAYLSAGIDNGSITEEARPDGADKEDMAAYAKERAAAISRS